MLSGKANASQTRHDLKAKTYHELNFSQQTAEVFSIKQSRTRTGSK